MLIADPDANTIFRFDLAAPAPEPLAILGTGLSSCWVERVNDDELLTSVSGEGLILVNTSTGEENLLSTAVVDPIDIDVLADGNFLVADPGAGQLISVDPGTFEGTTFSAGSTNCWVDVDPTGQVVAVGPDGVFLVDPQGGDPEFITNGVSLSNLSAVAWGSHGEIYVADKGSAGGGAGPNPGRGPTIVEVDPVTGDQNVIAEGGFLQAPSAIVVVELGASDLPALPAFGQGVLVVLLAGLAWAIWWNRRRASVDDV